jgi:hypothetical protein
MEITLIAIKKRKCSDILTLKRQPSARAMGEATLGAKSDIRASPSDIWQESTTNLPVQNDHMRPKQVSCINLNRSAFLMSGY